MLKRDKLRPDPRGDAVRIVIALATAMLLLGPAVGLRPRPCRSGVVLVPIDYRTIQDAIDAASPGSTILVLPGRYEESLRIEKPLRLVGLHATIDAGGQRYAVYVGSGGVTFQGFVVTGASWAGMFVTPYGNLSKIVIAANKFVSNDGWGLYVIEHREGVADSDFWIWCRSGSSRPLLSSIPVPGLSW